MRDSPGVAVEALINDPRKGGSGYIGGLVRRRVTSQARCSREGSSSCREERRSIGGSSSCRKEREQVLKRWSRADFEKQLKTGTGRRNISKIPCLIVCVSKKDLLKNSKCF